MNVRCLDILVYLSNHDNGKVPRETLMQAYDMRLIASLTTGTRPNMFLNSESGNYQLTQRGFDTMRAQGCNMAGARVTRESLPDFIRDANTGSAHRLRRARRNAVITDGENNAVNLISFDIDRNDYTTITCKVADSFKAWVRAHGQKRNFNNDFGSDTVRNWDANEQTQYYRVNLENIDRYNETTNIVCSSGLNSLIIKLACASDTNEYTVKYRGLIAWEIIENYATHIGEQVTTFHKNFIKPAKIKVEVKIIS